MSTPIRIKRSAVPGKIPTTSDLQLGELAINTYDGKAYLKKDVSGVETVINVGGGYPGQTYYVTKTGLDTNDGQNISAAFATVKKALTVATANDTILIGSGTYTEIFPLTVPQGVIVRGNGLRSTFIQPTAGTERLDAFLLNGENTIQDLSIGNFYYNSSTDTGYGFKFASNMVTTTRSPYIERVTVLNRGSTQTASDPYGFDTVDNYPTTKIAGRGALIDGSVVQSNTLEPAMLFNECTFITPNQTALKMTNGARSEWVNSFSYFSSVSIDGVSGSVGLGSTANATLKLAGVTTSISTNYVIKYYQGGPAVAIGTVTSVDGAYVTISGKGSGIFNAVGIGSTQDVRIFQSDGSTQVGTASTILWADYQKFGADLRAIGAASNFGTIGVRGDGAGVQLRLFGYNFGCVGSGKTFTQDPTLTVRSNEAVQLNGGRVFFQSVDQLGNFRVGNIFEISQETGAVSLASTSDINIAGTATIQNLNVTGVSTFSDPILHSDSNFNTDQTTYNLINSAAGAVNFAGAGTSIVIGATTGITTIRNYRVNLSGGQDSFTTTDGTLVVAGGVGISSNLNVGKDFKVTGVSTFVSPVRLDSSLRVAGVSTFVQSINANSTLNVTGVSTLTGNVRLGGQLNVAGISTLVGDSMLSSNLRVAGVSTFVQSIDANSTLNVTGVSTLTGNVRLGGQLRVAGISTFVDDVELGDHLRVAGVSTFVSSTMINSNLNVTGITTTGNFRVTGVSTLTGDTNLTNNLNVGGITTTSTFRVTGISTLTGNVEMSNALRVSGVSTFVGDSMFSANMRVAGVSTFVSSAMINSNLSVTGITTTENFRVTGVSTLTGNTNLTNNLNVGGITTTSTFRVTGISTLTGNVELSNALRVAGVSTFNNPAMINSNLNVTGITTTGNFRVTGISTLTGDVRLDNNLTVAGIGTISDFTISSGIITGPSAIVIDPATVGNNTGSVRIKGDFYVDGTTTTINSTAIEVADPLIGIGTTAINLSYVKLGGNVTENLPTITGINTDNLVVGYAISATYIGSGSTIVSIGASSVTSSSNFTVNSALGIGTNITIGIGTNTILVDGDYTTANIVGAGLSNGNLAGNTVITGVTTNTITFTPVSLNIAVETGNTIYIINNAAFTFVNEIGGDVIADGGGLLLYGSTTRSLTWDRIDNAWESSVNFNVPNGYSYKANGVNVLDQDALRIQNANITGIATINNLNVTGIGTFERLNVISGIVTGMTVGVQTVTTLNATTASVQTILNANVTGIATLPSTIIQDLEIPAGVGTVNTLRVNAGFVTSLTVTTETVTDSTVGTSTITTGRIENLFGFVGVVTSLSGTNITYSGIGSFGQIDNVYSIGISTIDTLNGVVANYNSMISTSFYNSGVGTFGNDVYINSGFATNFTITNGTLTNANITNEVVGLSTITIAGISTLNVTNLFGTTNNLSTLYVNTGFATVFNILSGIVTSLYSSGIGSIQTLYVNSGITTRSTITDLDVIGVGSFATIANVNTPLGLSTIGYLTGIDLNYSGIGTIQVLNVGVSTFTNLTVTGIASLANLYGSDIQYTGISTLTELRGNNLYYSGLSTAVNFRSTDTIVSGAASISTLRADVGITTNAVWTDGYSAGITSVATFRANSGIITTLTVSNSTQGYLIGTDIYYSGIGSISTLRVNVGFTTFLSGTNLSYTGVSTVVSLNATDVNVSGTTTITTLLISPNNQLTHLSNGTNLAFSGIGTIDTLRSNVGFVTSLSGSNLNYSGVGTIGSIQNININSTGIGTFGDINANNLNVSGVGTVGTLNITSANLTRLSTVDAIVSGASSISILRADIGITTNATATNINVTGIATAVTLVATNANITGYGTITQLRGTDSYFTGISTFGSIFGDSLQVATLDLSGTNLYYTGIATFLTLYSSNSYITNITGTNLQYTGISTISTIYNVDTNSTGFTTTGGLHVGAGGTIISATAVSGIGSVGINTSDAKAALHVYGNFQQDGTTLTGTISTTRNNNSAVKVHTELGRFDYRSVEYVVQVSCGNTHQIAKILSIHDGNTAYNSEYSNITTGVEIATFDVQIDNTVPPGSIALVVTPVSNTGVTTIVANFQATRI
jgi:hypothetical protein